VEVITMNKSYYIYKTSKAQRKQNYLAYKFISRNPSKSGVWELLRRLV
jgi:hypothetical protein